MCSGFFRMSLETFLDDFTDFCVNFSGPSGDLVRKLFSTKSKDGPVFFKPYQSTGDFFKRTVSIATAPVFLSLVSLELVAYALAAGATAFKDLFLNTSNAWDAAKISFVLFFSSVCLAIYAIASPITNLVDLVGGGIKTLTQDEPTEDLDSTASLSAR